MLTISQPSCLILCIRLLLGFGLEIISAIWVLSEGIVCLILTSQLQFYRYMKGICFYIVINYLIFQVKPFSNLILYKLLLYVLIWRISMVKNYPITCEDYEGFVLEFYGLNKVVSHVVLYHFFQSSLMHKSCKVMFPLSLCVFLLSVSMENLNIHETTNGQNSNSSQFSPESLLDCCLVGKVLINKPINFNALKLRLASFWQPGKGVTIKPIDDKKIMCQFFHLCDMERIFQGSPWLFDNMMVIFRKLDFGEDPMTVDFNQSEMWIQVHHVPYGFMNEKVGALIGSHIGELVKYDESNNLSPWRKFMKLRVRLNVDEPISKGWSFEKEDGKVVSVRFKYEKLGVLCHVCGIIGHTENFCLKKYDSDYVEKEKEWGNFLKAENNNMGGGPVTNKWLREGDATTNGRGVGGSGNPSGANAGTGWIEGSWSHKIHGRVKITRDTSTRSLVFFKRVAGKNAGMEDVDAKWIPMAVTVPSQPAVTVDLSSSVFTQIIIRHMNADKGRERETLELNGRLFSVTAPVLLTPTHPLQNQSEVLVPVHSSINFGLPHDQLMLSGTGHEIRVPPHFLLTNKASQRGKGHVWDTQVEKNQGTTPKKRVRLNDEVVQDGISGAEISEESGLVSSEVGTMAHAGDDITMHENPTFESDVNVKAGPVYQACLQK